MISWEDNLTIEVTEKFSLTKWKSVFTPDNIK